MSRKQKKPFKDDYACVGNDYYFGTMYESMCKSEAYQSLTIGARLFYMNCRVQSRSNDGKKCLYNHCKEFERQYDYTIYFVFPASHLEKYGYNRSNAVRYFNELEEKGFIEKVEKNQIRKKINVYRFSRKWKD